MLVSTSGLQCHDHPKALDETQQPEGGMLVEWQSVTGPLGPHGLGPLNFGCTSPKTGNREKTGAKVARSLIIHLEERRVS